MADRADHRPRELVFCHECHNEWYRDEGGLTCPVCQSDFTEIIEHDNDPRQAHVEDVLYPNDPSPGPPLLPDHNPWADDVPDPAEGDIGDVVQESTPDGSMRFTRITFRSNTSAGQGPAAIDPAAVPVFNDFQRLLLGIIGPPPDLGRAPRRRPFSQSSSFPDPGRTSAGALGAGTSRDGSPARVTGTFTYSSGPRLWPRDANQAQPMNDPVNGLPHMLQALFQDIAAESQAYGGRAEGGMAAGQAGQAHPFAALFSNFLHPGAQGDAVYSQEALDRVISQLMEQNMGSNAPGPASEAAIASLPSKTVGLEMLDDAGKAECSICMDEVPVGDEVTELPCHHWFHAACVTAWLTEHDTCPICRKGITPKDGEGEAARTAEQAPRHAEPWRRSPMPGLFGAAWASSGQNASSSGGGEARDRGRGPASGDGHDGQHDGRSGQSAEGNDGGGLSGRLRGWFGGSSN